jgi:hypothetical protein
VAPLSRFTLHDLANLNLSVFLRGIPQIEEIFPTVLQLQRRRDNFPLVEPIIFHKNAGNLGRQRWVGVMFHDTTVKPTLLQR